MESVKSVKRARTAVRLFRRRDGGMSTVEMAIIFPVILLCLCGVIDFGNLFVNWTMVNNAATTGALRAVNGAISQTDLQTAVRSDYGSSGNPDNNLSVTTSYGNTPPSAGSNAAITVTVTTPVSIITPMISAYFGSNPVTVTGSSTRMTEY